MMSAKTRLFSIGMIASLALGAQSCRDEDPARDPGSGGSKDTGGGGQRIDSGTSTPTPDAGQLDPDTGVVQPTDTGVPPPPADSGVVPPADTGVVVPPADTGVTPPADSGVTPPADTGVTPPVDGGVVPPDSGQPDAGTTPADAGVSPNQRAQTLAEAFCQHRTRCEPAWYSFENNTEADCIAEQTVEYASLFNAVAQSIAAGAVVFDQTVFDGCIAEFGGADCELGLSDGACNYFLGQRAQGDPCGFHQDCGNGLFCSRPALGVCGACDAVAQPTESCSNRPCARGSRCLNVGQSGQPNYVCITSNLPDGASCGTVGTGLCRGQLQCVSGMAGAMCTRPAASGAQCNDRNQGMADCNFLAGQYCENNTCVATTWGGATASCTPPAYCNAEATCDPNTSTCEARPAAGQPCLRGLCANGAFCDGQNNCQALKPAGDACNGGRECQPGLDCVGQPGQQTCQTLAWPGCGVVQPDAGVSDTGVNPDAAALVDAGVADTGVTTDSGVPPVDAGPVADAGAQDGGTTTTTVGDPLTPATHGQQLAAAQCTYIDRCLPGYLSYAYAGQIADCAAATQPLIVDQFTMANGAIADGRTAFSQTAFDECVQAYANADCDLGLAPTDCQLFVGSRLDGEACQMHDECGAGSWCAAAGALQCGACEPRAAVGASCQNAPCEIGARCAEQGLSPAVCMAIGTENEVCSMWGTQSRICRGRLQCIEFGSGLFSFCERPADVGQPCATDGSAAGCDVLQNGACVSGTCQSVSWVAPNAACDATNRCDENGVCLSPANTCQALPSAGTACLNVQFSSGATAQLCAPDNFCDGTDCQADRAAGGQCTSSSQCEGSLLCASNTCTALGWTQCN